MGIFSSIQKFRNKQIEKRERIRRVERALESTKKKKNHSNAYNYQTDLNKPKHKAKRPER